MESVKTEEELTSTMGNVLSTSKEEKNDSSDATPTSSTDANTNLKASQTVSDDPISSTSADSFDQSKLGEVNETPDETDKVVSEDHVGDLFGMNVPREKITEDVEDLVHDLESLLGETSEPFTLNNIQRPTGEGDASASGTVVEKTSIDNGERSKREVEDIKTDSSINVTQTVTEKLNLEKDSTRISSPSEQDVSKTSENSKMSFTDKKNESKTSTIEDQNTSDNTIQDHPIDSGVEISTMAEVSQEIESANPSVHDDEGSVGSWELIDASEADNYVSSTPGPSGEPVQAPSLRSTIEDITSSGDKGSPNDDQEGEENREAESTEVAGQEVEEQLIESVIDQELFETQKISEEIREAEPVKTEEISIEASTSSEAKIEEMTNNACQNIKSQNILSQTEITSSELCTKSPVEANRKFKQTEVVEIQTHGTEIEETETEIDEPYDLSGLPTKKDPEDREVTHTEFEEDKNKQSLIKSEEYIKEESPTNLKVLDAVTDCKQPKDMTQLEEDNTIIPEQKLDTYSKEEEKSAAESKLVEAKDDAHNISEIRPNEKVVVCTVINRDLDEHLNVQVSKPECSFESEEKVDQIESLVQNECTSQILQSEENLEQTEKVQQTSNDRKFGEKIDTVEESEEKKSVNIDEMLAVNETITESVLEEGNKTIIESTNISSVFEVTVTESSSDVATESKELDKNLAQTISEDSLKPASIEETMIKKIHKKETTSEKFIDDPVHEVTSKNTISVEIDVPIIIDSEKIMEEKKSIKEILNENSLGDTSKIPITPEKITSESELEGTTKITAYEEQITADNSVENIGKTSTSNENITTENVLEDNTKIVSEGKITADNTVENNSNTSTSDEKITYKSELEDNSKITMPEEKIPKECSVSKSSVNEISEKNDLNEIKECVSDVTKCTEPSVGSDDPPIVIDKELVSDNTDAPVTKDIEKNTDEPKISPQAHCENSTLTLSLQNKDKHKSVLIDEIKTDQKVDCVSATGRKRSQLAELEFAPLQLSEDDSDDSETVPRLALDPDESNSPLIADPAEEVPQMEEAIEAKPLFVQTVVPVIDTSDNLETMLAVASLQSIDIPKPNEMEQVVSEKERREMEALAIAVQSITDNSSSYVEEYVEPTSEHIEADTSGPEVIQEEPVIVREAESSNTVEIGPENILQENESVATRDADETMNASQGEDNNKNIENTITKEQKPLVESEVITVSEHPKESKVDAVESELKVKLLIQEEFKDNVVSNEIKDNETHVQQQDKLQSESKEIVDIRDMEVKSMESKENDENAFVDKKLDETSEKKDENTCHSSENSQDSTSEVFIKESKKSRLNDKPKKHKKADKYDELTINVDVPDREVTYSPKITIKPIKVPDEEVSTTTSGDLDISKGSLKMTITKQSDNMHSILKISDQENSDAISIPDEPIPKLIIKPKMHQIEQQHSPKMSTRSSKQSPTGSSQRSGSPRITIKPLVKPDKPEPVSPIKIKINTKANTKSTTKEEDVTRKVLVKPIKPHEEVEQVHSPRITIKPIPKPDNEKDVNPRLTIKPIKKPDEDIENEDKERSSPKVIIKPIVKPSEDLQTSLEEEELVKERIVLKINKGNLPSPAKESKKREHTTDDDKSEKLAKITVKFSKEGGHPHIVHQLGDETSSKRPNEEIPASAEKNKKQKVETDTLISTRSSARHKEQLEGTDKMSPGPEVKSKHKDLSMESPIETKRPRKDNLNDKSKLLKDENADELLFIETKVDSPIIISEDSRSQDSGSVILLEESKDDTLLLDQVKTPDISKVGVKTALLEGESATPSPVLKRGRGRPRKLPLEVRPEARLPEELSKLKEREVADQPQVPVHESGRPKRSCRGQSVCDTLGIKPRKPRGPGRGRGSKRGMGNRAIAEREPSSSSNNPNEETKEVIHSKNDVIVIQEEIKSETSSIVSKKFRKSVEKENKTEGEITIIEIDSGDSQLSEKELESNYNVGKNLKNIETVEPMEVDNNDISISGSQDPLAISDQDILSVEDKRTILKDLVIVAEKPPELEEKAAKLGIKKIIDDEPAILFVNLAPPSTSKGFSELDTSITSTQITVSSSASKSSNPEIPVVSSTTGSAEVMIVDEETRMSAETNSRAQTPAKQVINSSDIVEESQSSVHSSATTESGKTPSRPNKAPRLEVQEPDSQIITADLLTEYYWNGNGPFMLQEQVAQFLGIKSFKRKYPGIMRRVLDMQERDFIREKGLASEHMCDLGLTAVTSVDILDIMYSDFQDKYEEYCKHQRDRQAKELITKQKALTLATSQEKNKADITEQAVHSAAQWNARFNKERKEQRKACMDLQSFAIHYPKSKKALSITNALTGNYPVSLVPGQYAEYYKEYSPTELNNLPINTVCYDEVHFIPRDDSDESGSESDSYSSGSSGSSSCSSSDSDSSSGIEDCKLCKHSPKKVMSPPITSTAATAK